MVCKKSLYCLKNGPCASDNLRREIWEENIKFRENFRALNQADHYWSFQLIDNNCVCYEDEFKAFSQPHTRRTQSIHRIPQNGCSSVTHNGEPDPQLANSNLCPHFSEMNLDNNRYLTEEAAQHKLAPVDMRKTMLRNPNDTCARRCSRFTASMNNTFRRGSKGRTPSDEPSPICSRYKNELQRLTPNYKVKFASQPNLKSIFKDPIYKRYNLPNKNINSSQTNKVVLDKLNADSVLNNFKNELNTGKLDTNEEREVKKVVLSKKLNSDVTPGLKPEIPELKNEKDTGKMERISRPTKRLSPVARKVITPDLKETEKYKKAEKVYLSQSVPKPLKKVKRFKLPFTPITRTTKKIYEQEKPTMFLPYGYKNTNGEVGHKRTHNIYAAKDKDIYPHALLAHERRRSSIQRILESERIFNDSMLPPHLRKRFVNHSSVWMKDYPSKHKTDPSKLIRYFPPITYKHRDNVSCKTINVLSSIRRY